MTVDYATRDSIAVITLNRPPVNSLDQKTRQGLMTTLERALQEPSIEAIVLWGGPHAFCAGADIHEFSAGANGAALAEPILPSVVATLEASPKPVVAAIAGACMGGGLELALGCHFRLAGPDARFALPEIKLGILPGAGGTQRLPRAIGTAASLQMILSGEIVTAKRAAQLGLVRLVDGDLLNMALVYAHEVTGQEPRRLSAVRATLPEGQTTQPFFDAQRANLRTSLPAAKRCIDAVQAAVEQPFERGMQLELEYFKELVQTSESRALQYAFFSDRRAATVAGIGVDTTPGCIAVVGVVGAGTMGTGIAMCALNAGLRTILVEQGDDALARGLNRIRSTYDGAVKKGRIDRAEADRRLALLECSTNSRTLTEADLIIEAVFEDLAVKQQVFRSLDDLARRGTILASNTSTLDLNQIASVTRRPTDVVGLHFFSPANVMRLLEVVRGRETSLAVLATTMTFAKEIGKTAVIAQVCDGFIGNRMFEEYLRQAYFLLDEGATPWQVDSALEQWGMAMGPFAVIDLAGGDIGLAIRKRRAVEQPHRPYSKIPDRVAELGRFGQKTGAGFYLYDTAGKRHPDPIIDKLVTAYSMEIGRVRKAISDQEIVSRCIFALVNEGARLLMEEIAQRASDIDVVYRNGYGFPAHRGGPLFYADECGLGRVIGQMQDFSQGYHGEFWEVAPLLIDHARLSTRLTAV
jgi:3-hydroxyacyl-CoA dehydrogenase